MGEKVKKVPLNRLVTVETFEKVKALAVEMNVAEGVVIDRVVMAWVESVEQVIKAEEIGESEWGREVVGRLRMMKETVVGAIDEWKAENNKGQKKRIDGEVARIQGVWESAGQVAKAYEGAVAEVSRFDRAGWSR